MLYSTAQQGARAAAIHGTLCVGLCSASGIYHISTIMLKSILVFDMHSFRGSEEEYSVFLFTTF